MDAREPGPLASGIVRGARAWAGAMASILLAVCPAQAQDAEVRDRARALANEGDRLFAKGRCDQAIARWADADATYHAPTIVLRIARCEAILGRVVHAAAALESIVAAPVLPGDAEAFQIARQDAARELPAIQARIAHLVITVDGGRSPASAEIDGHAAPVGTEIAVDPGTHEVRVVVESTGWSRRESVTDGQTRSVRVQIVSRPAERRAGERTLGLVLGACGIAAMAVGAGFGAAAVETSHRLFDACGPRGNACPPGRAGQIDALKQDALVSDLALGTGAALFITGAVLLLTEKLARTEGPVQFDLVGAGVGLHGGF